MRMINDAGRKLIESFETLQLEAYPDPETGGDPWTIGYGHTGPDVHPGLCITETDAVGLLEQDLAEAERAVSAAVRVPLTDNQFSALVSLMFNAGPAVFHNPKTGHPTTLLTLLNGGDYQGAADQFPRWDHAGGHESRGLLRRRTAERELFLA